MKGFLTFNGQQRLQRELEWRKTDKRREIAQRLGAAVGKGDLAENAEYMATKEEQMYNETRIADLEAVLRIAKVVEGHPTDGTIDIGSKITVTIDHQTLKLQVVGSAEADPLNNTISSESPLGKELIGKKMGDIVDVKTPKGMMKYKITKVE